MVSNCDLYSRDFVGGAKFVMELGEESLYGVVVGGCWVLGFLFNGGPVALLVEHSNGKGDSIGSTNRLYY